MHVVPLDLVEDDPKHLPNEVTADIIIHCRYYWYFLFTTNKGKKFNVFGIFVDISLRFDLNGPCFFFLFVGSNMSSFFDEKTPCMLTIGILHNL